jgi:methionyl aminopeptidase
MTVRSEKEFAGLARVGRLAAQARDLMANAAAPGMTTAELDEIGAAFLRAHGARSAPQLVYGFPGFNLISVNDQIVHGVPGDRRLEGGDVVKIDVTPELDGFVADTALTVLLPPMRPAAIRLQTAARRALVGAIAKARAGRPVRALGAAVEREVQHRGCAVVRELTGHGVGRTIHEPPVVPNFGDATVRATLHAGLVITVEPLIAERATRPVEQPDGWTLCTENGSLAAHEEHTIMIREGKPPVVLTAA